MATAAMAAMAAAAMAAAAMAAMDGSPTILFPLRAIVAVMEWTAEPAAEPVLAVASEVAVQVRTKAANADHGYLSLPAGRLL